MLLVIDNAVSGVARLSLLLSKSRGKAALDSGANYISQA
jgi:hypothetical protein